MSPWQEAQEAFSCRLTMVDFASLPLPWLHSVRPAATRAGSNLAFSWPMSAIFTALVDRPLPLAFCRSSLMTR